MRKWALILLLILAVGAAGTAIAQGPPNEDTSDPTCGRGTQGHGEQCAGDNGQAGCQGIEEAEDHVPPGQGQDALDFVENILDEGPFNDCDDDEGRP